jgi:hypothetical protein
METGGIFEIQCVKRPFFGLVDDKDDMVYTQLKRRGL